METEWKGDYCIHRSQVVYFRAPLFLMLDRIRHCVQESQRMKMAAETRRGRNGEKDVVGNVERWADS